jgi:hypothetical protein
VDWTSVLEIAVGVLAGGAITAYFARQGSQELSREAKELKQEARELKQQTQLIMRMLREGLNIKVNQDAQGNIIGVWVMARAHIGGSSEVSGTPTERDDVDPAEQGQRMQGGE